MPDWNLHLLELHRQKLSDLHRRSVEAIRQLSDEDVNWRPNEESNSIANLILHMAGNLHQRLDSGIGGAPDTRARDAEFNDRQRYTRDQLLPILDESFTAADHIVGGLTPNRLSEPQWIRNREVTILDILFTVMTHMSEHVGQILYIAKSRLGAKYRVLSIPTSGVTAVQRCGPGEMASQVAARISFGEHLVQATWVPACGLPPVNLVTSAHGLCFRDGRVLMVELAARGGDIPGGHLEPGEDPETCFLREACEEGGVRGRCALLGYVVIDHSLNPAWRPGSRYPRVGYQAMYRMDVTEELPVIPGADSVGRRWVDPAELPGLHHSWHPVLQAVLDAALAAGGSGEGAQRYHDRIRDQ